MNPALPRTATLLMLLAFAAGCLLQLGRAPSWCLAVAACGLLWHWLHCTGRLPLPGRWPRMLLTVMLLAAILMSFGTINGLSAGSALLITMGGLKLLETRQPRDAVVVTTVALILVLAAGLDRQDLGRLPLYLATGWLALSTITALGSFEAGRSARLAFRRAGGAMLLAIPFAVLAFVFVPRLSGALWSMPGGGQAQTGLSDEMSPGGISDLAVSDAIAFRVTFEDAPPPPAQRYWRGPVLHDFDGSTWRTQRNSSGLVRQPVALAPPSLRYQVMLEPHHRGWLFTLETGASVSGRRHAVSADGQFIAYQPVTSALIYRAVSHLERVRSDDALPRTTRERDTRLPPGRNPRTLELARRLRAPTDTDADYARRAMRYFAEGGFEYTLTPPQLNFDSVDDLLFNTRLGFCGHFTSAFVTLMRAGGVPARVVTGYLGGTLNEIGGYYVVRQSDAHAWAEVWLEGEGWVRFDPTSMVAPARLQRGLNEVLSASRSATDTLMLRSDWLRGLRDAWDFAGSWWTERIVNFNGRSQRELLGFLGLGNLDYRGMAMILLAGACLWGAVLLAFLRPGQPRPRRDVLGRLWDRYLALLAKRGLPIASHEGPEAIRRRAQGAWPAAAGQIDRFTRGYEALRFGRQDAMHSRDELVALREQLRNIRRAIS